jgi:pyridine nucleotide-disulfide oxidoreductase family protein
VAVRRLVLAGGGHAHLAVLLALARRPLPDIEVTLVTPAPEHVYSGMLPGWIAGHYARKQIEIDLAALARRARVTLLLGRVDDMDADARRVSVPGRPPLQYDLLSLDVGSEIETAWAGSLGDRLLPLRPIAAFLERWPGVLATARERPGFRLAVVGAGAAGVEVALAVRHAFDRERIEGDVSLVAPPAGFLAGHGPGARRRAAGWLRCTGVALHEGRAVGTHDGLRLSDGSRLGFDCVVAATGAAPPGWLQRSGLRLDPQGYVAVDACHSSVSHGEVFAAGDVCSREDPRLARSGVHAVRAGPVLAANLAAALGGGRLREYRPRRRSLYLLACGPRNAIVSWGDLSAGGRWAWRWKDRIDRGFVGRHSVAPRTHDSGTP